MKILYRSKLNPIIEKRIISNAKMSDTFTMHIFSIRANIFSLFVLLIQGILVINA